MSGIVRPRGRAPAGIYWRRRLVLLAVVLLATAGAAKLVGGSGDDPEASATSSTEADNDAKSEGDSKPKKKPRPDRDRTDVRSGERNVSVRMQQGDACDPASVSVRPSVAPDSYAGGPVTLRLGLSTEGESPCVLSLDEQTPLLSVSAGGDPVWTSQRCDDLVDVDSVRLEPGWLTYVDAHWSGRSSRQTCGDNADFAPSGDYTVQAAMLGGEPTKATISLAEQPEEKPDKDDEDKSDPDKDDSDKDDSGQNESDQNEDAGDDADKNDESDGGSSEDRDKQDIPDKQDGEGGTDDQPSDDDRR